MGLKEREIIRYTQTLMELRNYVDKLNIEIPQGSVTIIPGTEGPGRPLGAKLPLFPPDKTGTDEVGMKHVLFNLASLLGFMPPSLQRR